MCILRKVKHVGRIRGFGQISSIAWTVDDDFDPVPGRPRRPGSPNCCKQSINSNYTSTSRAVPRSSMHNVSSSSFYMTSFQIFQANKAYLATSSVSETSLSDITAAGLPAPPCEAPAP